MKWRRGSTLVLVLVSLGTLALLNTAVIRYHLLSSRPPLTRELCQAQNRGKAWPNQGEAFKALKAWLGAAGPTDIPDKPVDITSVSTLAQLLAPGLRLVLDPIMFLQTQLKDPPPGLQMPHLIHFTLKDKHKVAPHQVLSILSWGKLNPGYTLLMYDNDDMLKYMRLYAPHFMPSYHRLTTPVERSDAWRYHVLCRHGGIYADTDTVCIQPVSHWLKAHPHYSNDSLVHPGLIVGIENRFASLRAAEEATYVRKVQMVQWTIASSRSHPVVCGMGAAIEGFMNKEEVEQMDLDAQMGHDATILLRTGPGIWSDGVGAYLAATGSSLDELVGGGQQSDLVVLPQLAFGCNVRFWSPGAPGSYVMHMYANSWKKDHFKLADKKKAQRKAEQWPARLRRRLQQAAPLLLLTSAVLLTAAVLKWRRTGVLAATVLPLMVDVLGGERQAALESGDKQV